MSISRAASYIWREATEDEKKSYVLIAEKYNKYFDEEEARRIHTLRKLRREAIFNHQCTVKELFKHIYESSSKKAKRQPNSFIILRALAQGTVYSVYCDNLIQLRKIIDVDAIPYVARKMLRGKPNTQIADIYSYYHRTLKR